MRCKYVCDNCYAVTNVYVKCQCGGKFKRRYPKDLKEEYEKTRMNISKLACRIDELSMHLMRLNSAIYHVSGKYYSGERHGVNGTEDIEHRFINISICEVKK